MGKLANHLGEQAKMNCGMLATITDYRDYQHIDLQFEDGTTVRNRKYSEFKKGNIANTNLGRNATKTKYNRLGTKKKMNCGLYATIIRYDNVNDIDVQFEDNVIVTNRNWNDFKNGSIDRKDFKSLLGQSAIMNCGMHATVVEDNNFRNIKIQFEDGTIVSCNRCNFNSGRVANPSLGKYASLTKRSRVGEYAINNSGIWMHIIEYITSDSIIVKFDDDTTKNTSYHSFKNGQVKHDTLNIKGNALNKNAEFAGLKVDKVVYKDKSDVYYICTCKKCGLQTILTPSEMLKHKCE